MIINLPFFNELDSDLLADYYEADIDLGLKKLFLDLNFHETSIESDRLLILKNYLDNLTGIIDIAENEIRNDFNNGEEVKEFLTFHIEELDQNELADLLKEADQNLSIEQQILSTLKLKRIGFYPDEEENFAVLDFTLNEDLSQYILVVNMTDNKAVNYITMES